MEKNYEQLDEQEKMQICTEKDKTYDGKFVLAVKSTKIYCRPSCKARTPLTKNMSFYLTPVQAESNGFRACKRCRPDLLTYEPEMEIANEMKEIIENNYNKTSELAVLQEQLCVSVNHQINIFKKQFGMTPLQYRNDLREARVKELLTHTDDKILDIALASGFESVSAFYSFFNKRFGISPTEYRQQYAHAQVG